MLLVIGKGSCVMYDQRFSSGTKKERKWRGTGKLKLIWKTTLNQ